jgi:CubicO group peptidase (beta-lactamase class C family)
VFCAACFLACLVPALLRADAVDDYVRAEMSIRKIPGLAVAVVRDGKVTTREYGLAEVENGAPVTSESVFAIASLDKQLTAAGVLKAAELGKLALEDPVGKWTPLELEGATLHHLLSHTSGLPDEVAGLVEGRGFTDYSTGQLLDTVTGLVPVAPPNERFLYSDAGIFLAQVATEKAAGDPWWDFMQRELFVPAGMTTVRSMLPGALIPHRVAAYTLDETGSLVRDRRLDVDFGPLYSDLGMTVADFGRWLLALDRGAPLSRASVARMTTPAVLASGAPASEVFMWSRYGLGVGLDDVLGVPVVLHSGHSGVGFVRFPDRAFAVVVFTNLEHPAGSDPVGMALGIAGLIEPAVSLAALEGTLGKGVTQEMRALLRGEYEHLLGGAPDLARYAPWFRTTVWEGAGSLKGRRARLGALNGFEVLRKGRLDGERTFLCRARHEHATVYLRYSVNDAGDISRLVWWHL